MDTLAPRLPGARVLDLFAGAGGVGLEALSRGAASVTFVEQDARAVAALRDNVRALGVADLARVRRGEVLREIPALYRAGERFDVVFLDPPYEAGLVDETLAALGGGGLLLPEAWVIAQHFTKRAPAETIGVLAAFRTRRFGETTLTFYRAAGAGLPA
jgi:16S rRNA (guanine(966)-N(2))-methyltransferase RsmD